MSASATGKMLVAKEADVASLADAGGGGFRIKKLFKRVPPGTRRIADTPGLSPARFSASRVVVSSASRVQGVLGFVRWCCRRHRALGVSSTLCVGGVLGFVCWWYLRLCALRVSSASYVGGVVGIVRW